MKTLVGILMALAFVFTTSFSVTSYAVAQGGVSAAEKIVVSGASDCHKTAQNDKDSSSHCGKGMCKCSFGSCHTVTQYFGGASIASFANFSDDSIVLVEVQFIDSTVSNRLKRPPKA